MSRRDETQSPGQEEDQQSQELAQLPPSVRERFEAAFASIPESDPDEAMERIAAQIFEAETPEELDEAWEGQSIKYLNGRQLRILELKRLPSDYAAGPRWYLGANAVLMASGETIFVSISSISCMLQLLAAHAKGWLPLDVVPRQSERKSRNGFYPMHLEMVR